MYALYSKKREVSKANVVHYEFSKEASLFGCKSGWIPHLMRQEAPPDASEPYAWEIGVESALRADNHPESALVIDLKPRDVQANLSLYELVRVWGYSANGWTPIMLQLRALFVDEDPSRFDRRRFTRSTSESVEPVFSFLYLSGFIQGGQLIGKWTAPPLSPTNSALLWPDSLDHFLKGIQSARSAG